MCRCQLSHFLTSYSSRPTSLFAASRQSSMISEVNTCHPAADVSSGEYGLDSLSFDLRATQRWIGGTDVSVFGLVGRKQSRDDQGA